MLVNTTPQQESVWKPRVTVAAVIEQQGKYLMVEEWVDGQRTLNQPAGHLEFGESLLQAAAREVLEETGYAFQAKAWLGVALLSGSDPEHSYLRFSFAGQVDGEPAAVRDADISAVYWLSRAEIENHAQCVLRSQLVLHSLKAYEGGMRLPLEALQTAWRNQNHD